MVNIAFVISLVASAVFLIVSIAIFSDVVEAMELTLPIQGAGTPATGFENATADWSWREHDVSGSDSALQWLHNCVASAGSEAGCEGGETDDHVQINDRTDANAIATESIGSDWLFFKSDIPASYVDGKNIAVTWAGLTNVGSAVRHQILVYDGSYTRSSQADIPTGSTLTIKGAGLLQTCYDVVASFALTTTNCVLSTSGSTTGTVTIFINKIQSDATSGRMNIRQVVLTDYHNWNFNNAGTTVTREVQATDADYGFATAGSSTVDPALLNATTPAIPPPPLTAEEQQQVDTFNNAQAIGFTVIGIMPIALFFALFTILDPRMGGQIG